MRLLCVVLGVLPATVWAQQSFFNVPSTTTTLPGALYGQVQVGAGANSSEIGATLEMGLLPWLEAGVSVLHAPLYSRYTNEPSPIGPAFSSSVLNLNVYFEPLNWLAMQLGVQGGVGFVPPLDESGDAFATVGLQPVVYGFGAVRFSAPKPFGWWVLGLYAGNRWALGSGPPIGGMLGFEIPLWENVIHLQADWLIGFNDISAITIGPAVFVGRSLQISGGIQLPSPGTTNPYGGIIALTFTPVPPEDEKPKP